MVPSNAWRELYIGLGLILFAHACDLASTYWRTPDLALEASPVYIKLAELGFGGWSALLAVKGVGIVLSIALFLFYMRKRREFYPEEAGRTFHQFLHDVHSTGAIRKADGQWLMPSPMMLFVWMCFTVSIGSAAYAYFLAVHNVLGTPLLSWLAGTLAPAAVFMVTAIAFWRTLYGDYCRSAPG